MPNRNPLERRATLLGQRIEQRMSSLFRELTDPEPPFMVKMSEQDQVRRYLEDRQSGNLAKMRESNGGPYRDEDVDRYAAWGERHIAEQLPHLILRDHQTSEGGPLHPGLLAALGLDQQAPPAAEGVPNG